MMNVSRNHPDYDDFVQQGLLKLVEAYEIFPKDSDIWANQYPFGDVAYTKIKWHLLRKLHKLLHVHECYLPDYSADVLPETGLPFEKLIEDTEWIKEMLALLTENE